MYLSITTYQQYEMQVIFVIWFSFAGHENLFEGDIVLNEDQQGSSQTSSGGNPLKIVKWPGGIVHYAFHPQFGKYYFSF